MRSCYGRCAVFGLAVAAGPPSALADSFYCGPSIISEGMTIAAIRERCGEPDLVETMDVPVFARLENGVAMQVGVETKAFWYYDRGPNQFVAQLTIEASAAERIELLSIRDIEALRKR